MVILIENGLIYHVKKPFFLPSPLPAVVTARNCVKGRTFSVMESANGWSRGLMSLVDMLFGLPMLDRADVEHEIEKENSR